MTSILACHLTPAHVGSTVAFYEAGRRVCGVLDGFCRRGRVYSVRVDGSWHRGVPCTAEVDVIGVTA